MSSWTADLPRAALRALFAAVGCTALLLLLERATRNMGATTTVGLREVGGAFILGVWTIPLTLLEGRLAARPERAHPLATFLSALWPAASLLLLGGAVNAQWVGGVLDLGFSGGMAALEEALAELRSAPVRSFLAAALIGGGAAAASLATLERGRVRAGVVLAGLLGLVACFPGVAVLGALIAFSLGDLLAARLFGGARAQSPQVALLERLLETDQVARSRAWLLAYLGDPVARAVVRIEPAPPAALGAWLERLDNGGRTAGVRAALAAARLVLPRLRAQHPDDLRADAVAVAVEAWLEEPAATALADVRAAVSLLGIPGPEADAVRAAALACEGTDRWAARNAAQQAALAGEAAVAAGHDPAAVRAAIAETLRAWADVPGLAALPPADAAPPSSPLATLAAALAPTPTPAAKFVLWREDDNGARYQVETFTDERAADDARRTFDATGHKQRYWVERA